MKPDELAVLSLILDQPFDGVEILRAQIPYARVIGKCSCGCATVDLAVPREAVQAAPPYRPVPVDYMVRGVDGEVAGGIILFADEGYLSMLEIYSVGDDPIAEFPPTDRLDLVPHSTEAAKE